MIAHPLPEDDARARSLARLDPRVKLLSAIAILGLVLSSRGVAFPLAIAAAGVGTSLALGASLRRLAHRLAEPFVLMAAVVLFKLLFAGEVPLFTIRIAGVTLHGHADGLREGLALASRIAGALGVVTALGFATPFTEVMAALAWLRVPRTFVEIALLAWRFLFVLLDDAQSIQAAQRLRLGHAGPVRRLRSAGTLAGALVVKAFDRSQAITAAMVLRGYDGTLPLVRRGSVPASEVLGSTAVIAALGVLWAL